MNKKRPLHGKKTEKSDNFLSRMSIKTIILSVVALIQIMLLITGTTFSWVETISSLALTGGGKIDNPVMTVANIGSGTGYDKALDLDAYFKKAGNVHLSTCSSADGQNFYFPIVGDNNNYRQSTVNDRNVNYIGYNLKVVNKEKNKSKDFKFGKIPSIKIGNEAVTDNRVRIAITVDGVTKIFSNKDDTENVVAATDGTLSETTVNAFDKYTNSDEKVTLPVFSIPANSSKEVKISLWLQDSNGGNNGDVVVNDFKLVVSKKRVEVEYGTGSDKTMGDISIGSNKQQFCYGEEGEMIPLNASAEPGYKFMGWYKDNDCTDTDKVPVPDGKFEIGSDSNITLYALFKKTYTVNVIAVTDNVQGGKGGTVKINSDTASDKASKSDVTVGETVKLTATPTEGYKFVGWYDSVTGGTQITGVNPTDVGIDSANPKNRTIYARFEIKEYTVTASAVSKDDDENIQGNKITYGDEQKAQVKVTVKVKHGNSVTFTAVPVDGSGYVFDGWYSDKACSSANKLSREDSYTVSSVKADQNIYAKFVLKTFNVEAYAYSYSDVTALSEQSAYGNVKSGNESGTHLKLIVKYGKDFSFTSVSNDYCDFENWYSDKNCETSVSSDKTTLISGIGEKNVTYYAKFKIKTKTISVGCQSKSDVGKSSVGINGSTNTSVSVNLGAKVELVATADSNYEFKGWYTDDNCTGTVVSTDSSYVINPVVDSTPEKFYAKFEKKKSKIIYFRNSGKWDSVYAYIWKKGTNTSNAAWPGSPMSKVSDISNGYEMTVDDNTFSQVIFNNNSGIQTATLDLPQLDNSYNCYFLIKTSNNATSGEWSSYSPDGDIRIYLTNTRKWSSVCCYYKVNGGSDFEKKPMTNTKLTNSTNEPIYYVDIPNESASIKFGTNDSAISTEVTNFIYASAYFMDKNNTSNNVPGEW